MISHVRIFRIGGTTPRWDADTGQVTGVEEVFLWEGRARVQDNKDWRARHVRSASDPQIVQYVRVQIPLKRNYQSGLVDRVPHIYPGDIVEVLDADVMSAYDLDPDLSSWRLRVRNSVNSSYPWLRNLLCGTDVSEESLLAGEDS